MAATTHRSRVKWALVIALSLILVLVAVFAVGVVYVQNKLDDKLVRFGDPFASLDADRPAKPQPTDGSEESAQPVNFLFLGSDSRISAGNSGSWQFGAQRTDAIMIASISSDRDTVSVMSIPRDSWVPVSGYGHQKINAAYSYGGPSLMVQTVEDLTGIRIDHVVISDFESFTHITDELGGVEITLTQPLQVEDRTISAGTQVLNGKEALAYTRQRHGLSEGDFSRMQRQQNWMRAVLRAAFDKDVLTSPAALTNLLTVVVENVAVDDGLSIGTLRDLALSMRSVRPGDVTFFSAPVAGTGRSPDGSQSIVNLDFKALDGVCEAFVEDRISGYVDTHDDIVRLGSSVE